MISSLQTRKRGDTVWGQEESSNKGLLLEDDTCCTVHVRNNALVNYLQLFSIYMTKAFLFHVLSCYMF